MLLNKKPPHELPIIGPKTLVDFLDYNIVGVPAKVDTGAHTSSVWATQIKERNGVLSFKLLGPVSSLYSGELITTKEYKVRKVKNSFGTSEFRYQVMLRAKLEGKLIKINATLANRENNRFPILIGARTLKNKFLVDVGESQVKKGRGGKKQLLILVDRGSDEARAGLKKVQAKIKNHVEISIVRYVELRIEINNSMVSVHVDNKQLSDYQLIYFFSRVKNEQIAAIVAAEARKLGINFMDQAAEKLYPNGKMHQLAALSAGGIKVPDTIFVYTARWEETFELAKKKFGLPFIFKDNAGKKGRHNYLVNTKAEFLKLASEAQTDNRLMLAQRFIVNEGSYRLLVLGGKVPFVSYREIKLEVSHFFKKENGITAKLIKPATLPLSMLETASKSAELLQINIAGVDMVKDEKTGMWYCLEVNSSPQLVNGSLVDEKLEVLSEFFKQETEF